MPQAMKHAPAARVHPPPDRCAALTSALLLALLAAGCSTSPLDFDLFRDATGGIGGASDFVGAAVCRGCHSEIHQIWAASKHAAALEPLRASGDQNNRDCLTCHATGYRQGGFVSDFATPGFAGVQCEGCHGAGARHVGSRNPEHIIRTPSTAICGNCHTGPQQPNLEELSLSRHAQSLADVLRDPTGGDECLICHSADYALAVRRNNIRELRGLQALPLPSIDDDDSANDPREAVGCGSCHNPHGSEFVASLRQGSTTTCVICHSDPQPAVGVTPHAPQWNLLTGEGGRRFADGPDGSSQPLDGIPAVHSTLDRLGGCAKCHGQRVRVEQPTAENPNKTGHQFEVVYSNCPPCHSPADAELFTTRLRGQIEPRIEMLQARIAAFEGVFLTGPNRRRLDAARLNLDLIRRDGSDGVHNAAYTRQLLDAAEELLGHVTPGI